MTRIWSGYVSVGNHATCDNFRSSAALPPSPPQLPEHFHPVNRKYHLLSSFFSFLALFRFVGAYLSPFMSARCLLHKKCSNTLLSYRHRTKPTITSNSSTRRSVLSYFVLLASSSALAHPYRSRNTAHEVSRFDDL